MNIVHFGHACVLVEIDGARILIDPGAYSKGFEHLSNLDGVIITHSHADHVDLERLPGLLQHNRTATLISGADVAPALPEHPFKIAMTPGATYEVGGVTMEAVGTRHAEIHPLIPNVPNTGVILGGRVWHPGDSFDAIPRPVDVLLLPIGGPWMRLLDAIDFMRAVAPKLCVPIHEAGLSPLHQVLHIQLLEKLAPEGTEFAVLDQAV